MAKKSKTIKKTEVSEAEKEKLEILQEADKVKGEQLSITPEGSFQSIPELKDLLSGSTDNPPYKYELYYKGIMKLLRDNLPKGRNNKKARSFIYEEKNVFLTRGNRINKWGIRKADSRMAYLTDAKELLDIIIKWVSKKDTAYNLYETIKDLNEEKGYNTPKKN